MIDVFREIQAMVGHDPENLRVDINRGNYKMYSTTCKPEYMIRVFRDNNAIQVQEKFIAEAHMLGVMFEYKEIPSPELVAAYLNEPENLILVMEKLDGIPLHQAWKYLSTDERLDLAMDFGEMLNQLHQIHQDGYGIPNQYERDWLSFLQERVEIGLDAISSYLSPTLQEKTRKKSQEWLTKLPIGQPVITHGDLHPHNILIQTIDEKPTISGIIDWEWAISAPSNYDLASLESLFYNSPTIVDAFYRGYGTIPNRMHWECERKMYLLDRFLQNARYYVVTGRYTKQQQHLTRFMLSSILK